MQGVRQLTGYEGSYLSNGQLLCLWNVKTIETVYLWRAYHWAGTSLHPLLLESSMVCEFICPLLSMSLSFTSLCPFISSVCLSWVSLFILPTYLPTYQPTYLPTYLPIVYFYNCLYSLSLHRCGCVRNHLHFPLFIFRPKTKLCKTQKLFLNDFLKAPKMLPNKFSIWKFERQI